MILKSLLLIWAALFILLSGCSIKHPSTAPHGELLPGAFISETGALLDKSQVIKHFMAQDFVLIGESHNMLCDHETQAKLIDNLAMSGHSFIVGMEMVSVERQGILDDFNAGLINLDKLQENLEWDQRWGFDFFLYEPIFRKCQEHGIEIKALNVPSQVTRKISREGIYSLEKTDFLFMPDTIIYPPPGQMTILEKQFDIHRQFMPSQLDYETGLDKFILAQSVWDSMMAFQAVEIKNKTGMPVVILAGNEHVIKGRGIEHRIRILMPHARISRIVPVRSVQDIAGADPFNYYCPAVQERMRLGIVASVDDGSVVVMAVVDGSLAEASGLEQGDVILAASGLQVDSMTDLHDAAVKSFSSGEPLELEVLRGEEVLIISISTNDNS
ncbi:ChaN family lipoprotein [Desulfonatronovibrio magnus]|uniref:ChaN family lipoprotein n=1 Tax=Desulfonatronovibrio magnus TaxID=698827 RepID=UPI000696CCB8|nr:ChaN family lipoprotein [Desulfonatronovibrio magnus]